MPNSKIILTKSGQANATPHPNDLDFGELAINYEDGLLFFKNASNRISKIASSNGFSQLSTHLANRENPHGITAATIELENVTNTSDADKPVSNLQLEALNTKVDKEFLSNNHYDRDGTNGRIESTLEDIEAKLVNLDPSPAYPDGLLLYTKNNNTFSFIKPTIPTLDDLGGVGINNISIDTDPNTGNGALSYEGNGVFSYDQPTIQGLDGFARAEIILNPKTADIRSDGSLTYDSNGKFTYDKPLIGGLTGGRITFLNDILTIEGYAKSSDLSSLSASQDGNITALREEITEDIAGVKQGLEGKHAAQQQDIDGLTGNRMINFGNVTGVHRLTQEVYDELSDELKNSDRLYIIVD